MAVGSGIQLNLRPLEKFASEIEKGLRSGSGPMKDAVNNWERRYYGEMLERFDILGRGGSYRGQSWPDLAHTTKVARRMKGKKRTKKGKRTKLRARQLVSIRQGTAKITMLRDYGQLRAVIEPQRRSAPGKVSRGIPFGVETGFGGPGRKEGSNKATIAEVAVAHQFGRPGQNLPARPILVDPAPKTVEGMADDTIKAIDKIRRANQVRS